MDVINETPERSVGRSAELFARAVHVMPGGDTRTCVYQDPHPLAIVRGHGAEIWDADGNRYLDLYTNGFTLLHGHAYEPVVNAITEQVKRGTAWSGMSIPQVEFAELLCERIPSAELVRFCASGSEAGMLAAKIARRATGRRLLLKTSSGYHGSYDPFDFGAGEADGVITVADGDVEVIRRTIAQRSSEIAAVFLELASVSTALSPGPDYVAAVRDITRDAGIVLVFDECITFRNARGGMQELFGVTPDLTMLAKFIGGGLPVGALVGSAALMEYFDPRREDVFYHSGSYNGYVLGMASGLVALREYPASMIETMISRSSRLVELIRKARDDVGLTMSVDQSQCLIGLQPLVADGRPKMPNESTAAYRLLQRLCLTEGLYLQPMEGVFVLPTVVDDRLVDEIAERFHAAFAAFVETADQWSPVS